MRAAGRQTEDRVGVFSRGLNAGNSRGSVYGGTDTHPDMSAGRDAARPRTGSAEARAIQTVSGPRGAKGVSATPRTSAGGGLAGEGAGGDFLSSTP